MRGRSRSPSPPDSPLSYRSTRRRSRSPPGAPNRAHRRRFSGDYGDRPPRRRIVYQGLLDPNSAGRNEAPRFSPPPFRHPYDAGDRRRRIIPSNTLNFEKEMKHIDWQGYQFEVHAYDAVLSPVYHVPIFPTVVGTTQGVTADERMGNKIRVHRLAMRFYWATRWTYVTGAIIPPPGVPSKFQTTHNVRMCVVRDLQCNGADISSTTLPLFANMSSWNVGQFRDTAENSRFEFLYDQIHTLEFVPPVTYTQEVATVGEAFAWFGTWRSPVIDIFIDTDFEVSFNDGGISPTSIRKNNVFIVCFPTPMDYTITRHQLPYLESIIARSSYTDE